MSKLAWMKGLKEHQFKKGQESLKKRIVHQYTKDGIFIKTWESAADATLYICGKDKKSHGEFGINFL